MNHSSWKQVICTCACTHLDEVPVATRVRVRGHRLEHEGRTFVCEGSAYDVGVASDPVNVRSEV